MSEQARKLEPLLRELRNDDIYVQSIILNAGNDKNLATVMKFIVNAKRNHRTVFWKDLGWFALSLNQDVLKKTNKSH